MDEAVQAAVAKAIKETTALFLRRFYGPRNERFDPRQLLLFGLKIDEMPLDEASIAEESDEELDHSPRGEAAQARPPPAAGPSAANRHRARS